MEDGGSDFIQGITEEYLVASGGKVNAGDFVKFITDYSEMGSGTDTKLSTETNSEQVISAVVLNETKVFIAYTDSTYIYEIICIINNTTITKGTTIKQDFGKHYDIKGISAVKLNENRVFIPYVIYNTSYSDYQVYGFVCAIDNTTITAGSNTDLMITTYNAAMQAIAISENDVFIIFCNPNSYRLMAGKYKINNYTITYNRNTTLSNNDAVALSAVKLSNDKIFITYETMPISDTDRIIYGNICTVSGTDITPGTDVELVQEIENPSPVLSAITLNENKVFVAFSYNVNKCLYGIVCTVNGTTISKGTVTQLSTVANSGQTISAVMLNQNKVAIIHSQGNDYLYNLTVNISGTTIIKGEELLLSNTTNTGFRVSTVLINEGNSIFIAHSRDSSYYLYGLILNFTGKQVKTITSSKEVIGGVALSDGNARRKDTSS